MYVVMKNERLEYGEQIEGNFADIRFTNLPSSEVRFVSRQLTVPHKVSPSHFNASCAFYAHNTRCSVVCYLSI